MTPLVPRHPRPPLIERKRSARRAARARIAARTVRPLPADQRGLHPTALRPLPVARVVRIATSLLSSAVLHGAVVGAALAASRDPARPPRPTPVVMEVRDRPPEPPPPVAPPQPAAIAKAEPPPPPEPPKPEPRQKPRPPATPPPVAPPPTAAPPPRVVGISMDSTTAGGDGPGFAVGNTRGGETAARAVDPTKVAPVGVAPTTAPPVSRNQIASRVPAAGVKYVLPRRKRPSEPPYPETLKSQGIEADVTVLVKLGADGVVTDASIVRSSGHPEFDQAARSAARAEAFEPATRDGAAVPYTLSFTYHFRLESP